MKKNLFTEMKKHYDCSISVNEQTKKDIKRLAYLKSLPEIIEYLSLKDTHDPMTENEIVRKTIYHFSRELYNDKENPPIYVYIGTYIESIYIDIVHGATDESTYRNNPKADYSLYYNLYTMDRELISIQKRESFEENQIIIFADRNIYDVQDIFFKDCMEHSEEYAIEKLLNTYNHTTPKDYKINEQSIERE